LGQHFSTKIPRNWFEMRPQNGFSFRQICQYIWYN
jgi:hypothetical protein